jgi:tetratricopeptide (TPR) repeat protein
MKRTRIAVVFLIAVLGLLAGAPACAATNAPAANCSNSAIRPCNNALAARAFNELYNADYDPAIRDFRQLRNQHPDDPFTSNYLLAAELFKELSRIGALSSESYSNNSFLDSKARLPLDPAVQKEIFALIARVESLCNARLQKNPNDVDALYARGVARGFRALYMGMAEKSWMAAIRSALSSRRDHERVLQLDPGYVDAKMTVGIHNYIIGSLSWPTRMAVALVGVTGNKQKGLDYLREVSRSHSTASVDASMALALFLRREQRYAEALALVSRLSREYPRNYLMAIEYAHLLNAAGHGPEAVAQFRSILERGREGKFSSFEPAAAAWGLGVSLRGQREFEQAAEAFDEVTRSPDANPVLMDRARVAAGEMYDTLGRRDEAVADYREVVDSGREDNYVSAARKHLRHPYRFVEDPPAKKH